MRTQKGSGRAVMTSRTKRGRRKTTPLQTKSDVHPKGLRKPKKAPGQGV